MQPPLTILVLASTPVLIPALLFANDSLLFCRASSSAYWKLKYLLDTFCAKSRQMINYYKSTLIFSKGVRTFMRNMLAVVFNITPRAILGKYLGMHLG